MPMIANHNTLHRCRMFVKHITNEFPQSTHSLTSIHVDCLDSQLLYKNNRIPLQREYENIQLDRRRRSSTLSPDDDPRRTRNTLPIQCNQWRSKWLHVCLPSNHDKINSIEERIKCIIKVTGRLTSPLWLWFLEYIQQESRMEEGRDLPKFDNDRVDDKGPV